MHALVRFAHIAGGNTFQTADLYPHVLETKVAQSRRYRLLPQGYSICLVFLKLFDRIYAPLTAGLLEPVSGDSKLQQQKRTQVDRLYQKLVDDLERLMAAVGPARGAQKVASTTSRRKSRNPIANWRAPTRRPMAPFSRSLTYWPLLEDLETLYCFCSTIMGKNLKY
jgi:hypothetical protein